MLLGFIQIGFTQLESPREQAGSSLCLSLLLSQLQLFLHFACLSLLVHPAWGTIWLLILHLPHDQHLPSIGNKHWNSSRRKELAWCHWENPGHTSHFRATDWILRHPALEVTFSHIIFCSCTFQRAMVARVINRQAGCYHREELFIRRVYLEWLYDVFQSRNLRPKFPGQKIQFSWIKTVLDSENRHICT